MKKVATLLCCIFLGLNVHAQYTWLNNYGSPGTDWGYTVLSESGYIYCGGFFEQTITFGSTTLFSKGGKDIYIVKLDGSGQVVWAKNFGGAEDDDIIEIVSDGNGNLYFSGSFNAIATFGSCYVDSKGESDAYLCCMTTDGVVNWVKGAGGTGSDQGYRLSLSPAGDFVAWSGYFRYQANFDYMTIQGWTNREFFIARVDADGTLKWVFAAPGDWDEGGYSSDIDPSGNIYAFGYFFADYWHIGTWNLVNMNVGSADCFLMKIDSAGSLKWAKSFGGYYDDLSRSINYHNGYLYLSGYHEGPGHFLGIGLPGKGGRDSFLIKADPDGNAIWATDGLSIMDDEICRLALDDENNIYAGGGFAGTMSVGNQTHTSAGLFDAFCIKYDGFTGEALSAITGGGPGNDTFFGVASEATNAVVLTGYFSETANFGGTSVTSSGYEDILVTKVSDFPVRISELSIQGSEIFPNPARDQVTFRFKGQEKSRLFIRDSKGRLIKTFDPPDDDAIRIDCTFLSAGQYYVSFEKWKCDKTLKFIVLK